MFRPRILLVRHGETDDNKNRIFQGQKGSGLNPAGQEQARRLAQRLASAKIAAVFSSDLQRAKETAEVVAAQQPEAVSVTLVKELREVDVGSWSGLPYDTVREQFPEEWEAWRQGLDIRRGGGETFEELGGRMMKALGEISASMSALGPDAVAVCVSHGGAIRSVMNVLLGHGSHPRVLAAADNTSITLIERDDTEQLFRVAVYNDTNHVADAIRSRIPAH